MANKTRNRTNRLLLLLFGLCLLCPLWTLPTFAQSEQTDQLPRTTEGTDFWIAFPSIKGTEAIDGSLQLLVMATSNEAVEVQIDGVDGTSLGSILIPAGGGYGELKVAPASSYLTPLESERVQNKGLHIYAKDGLTPFSCFAQVESGPAGASQRDATLLLPEKTLGYEYLVQTNPQDGKSTQFVVVATEDNTTVVIVPTAKGYNGSASGVPTTKIMNRGTSLLFASQSKEEGASDTIDLSGSLICSDRPIAVYTANEAVRIPHNEAMSDDYTLEQIPPIGSLGTKFFISRPDAQVQNMFCSVTALYDNTVVTERRHIANSVGTVTTTLAAGQSLAVRPPLNQRIADIVIESSAPVLCYTYFTSAANNEERGYDELGNPVVTGLWGDPANAMLTAWDQRVTDITFFTRPLLTQTETDVQHHYVQLTLPKSDISSLQLDGTPVSSSLFHTYGADNNMVYGSIPLTTYNKHRLTTTGEGFTGYVYGISEGVAYLYTLGFRPDAHPDSLFISEDAEIMSPRSYDLDRFTQGWYQRQLKDWPVAQERLDTAYICDSTTLHFTLQTDRAFANFVWEVWQLDKRGRADSLIRYDSINNKNSIQKWENQFTLDLQKGLRPEQRDPYTDYIVYARILRDRIICPDENQIADTLRTVIRVNRAYNDTVQKIMCSNDEVYFFSDSVYKDAPKLSFRGVLEQNRDSTRFIGDTINCRRGQRRDNGQHEIRLGLGEHYISRLYETQYGCDSLVTFAVYVCPSPDTTWIDTLLLHDRTSISFPNEENTMFAGKTFTQTGIYTDNLIASHCDCPNIVDSTFVGCDSVVVMRIQLRDTLVVNFCDSTANPKLYGVNWREYDWTGHDRFPSVADSVAVGETREFHDYYKTADGLDSCYTLILTREPVTVVETIVDWPNNRPFVWKYGDGSVQRTDTIIPDRTWLDVTITRNRRINYENGCPMLFHLEVTFKETYFTIREVDICDVDTAEWRGKIYAGAKWRETYPNPTFHPDSVLPVGAHEICVDSFRTVIKPERDSLFYLQVNIHATYHEYDTVHICDNEVVRYNKLYFAGPKAETTLHLRHRLGATENIYRFDSVFTTIYGCDSVCSAVFYLHTSYQMPLETATICADEDFQWVGHSDKGHTLYDAETSQPVQFGKGQLWTNSTQTTFTLVDSLQTEAQIEGQRGGCDSIHTLQLTVNPVYGPFIIDTTVCRSKYNFEWIGHPDPLNPGQNLVFDQNVTGYYDTLKTVGCNCDSIFVLNLTFFDDAPRTYDTAVCHNAEPFLMGTTGEYFHPADSTLGLHVVTRDVYLSDAQHCPYIETWNITVYPDYNGFTNSDYCLYDTICRDTTGGSYDWISHNGFNRLDITRPGTYTYVDSLLTTTCYDCAKGCDSIWVLRLTVLPSYYKEFQYMMSDEETYTWEGITYGGINTRTRYDQLVLASDTLIESHHNLNTGTYTCDSTVILHLRVGKVYRDTTYDFVCDNCLYDWHRTIDGKDSLMADSLQVDAGDTLILKDAYLTTLGFDSVYYLALVGMPTYHFTATNTACQYSGNYDWTDHEIEISLRDTGWFTITDSLKTQALFVDPHGTNTRPTLCDSIWTLSLYVAPVYDETFHTAEVTTNDVLCSNETYLWERTLMVGHDFDFDHNAINISPALYDSIIYLTTADYDAQGIYHHRLDTHTVLGCDSIRFLHLNVHSMAFTMLYDTIGDNNTTWHFGHGQNYISGKDFHVEDYTVVRDVRRYFFVDTVLTANGCDSIIHDSLLVVPTYRFVKTDVTCSGVTYNWRKYTELNKLNSGLYYDSLYTTAYGADSTYVLDLTIVPNFRSEQTKQMCKNDTLQWQYKRIYYEMWNEGDLRTEYHAEYVRPGACDSFYVLYMTYYDYYHLPADTDSVCQYDTYRWYTNGIEHTTALYDEQGNHLTAVPTDTVGWITIYDSLHTSSPCHCDSTFMLRLYVKPSYYFRDTINICSNDTAYWHDRPYSSPVATTLRDTIPVATGLGCDSIYYLTVQIKQAYFFNETDHVCGSQLPYTWQGHSANIPIASTEALLWDDYRTFVLWDSCLTVEGCDSIYRRTVTVVPIRHTILFDTICDGDVLQFHQHALTHAGTYTDTLTNLYGCDSMVTLVLYVIPPTRYAWESIPAICADDQAFDLSFTASGAEPLAYSVVYDEAARAHRFEDIPWTALTTNQRIITIPLPTPESATDYPTPYNYTATVYFDNGFCLDTALMALPLPFQVRYPSWIMEQHWNDAIGLLVDSLNGGYHFVAFQWYKNDVLMPGETKPYLYCPQYLESDAVYSVALTRQSDMQTHMTCYLTPDLSQQQSLTPQQPYIAVVPTLVVRENPVVNILCVNSGNYELYDAFGVLITSGVYHPGTHNAYQITLPANPGVYIFHLHDAAMLERTVKIIVQ